MQSSGVHSTRRSYPPRPSTKRAAGFSGIFVVAICLGLILICLIAIWLGELSVVPLQVSVADVSRLLAEKLSSSCGQFRGTEVQWWNSSNSLVDVFS